jgi:hypothetical protein
MKAKGYFSKKSLLKSVIALEDQQAEIQDSLVSNEVQITPLVVEKPKKVQSNLSYISAPTQERYNFVSEDNVLIK